MKSKIEIDLSELMPSWGENKLTCETVNADLLLKVFFDGENNQEKSTKIIFRDVCFYSVGSFPGISSISHNYDVEEFNSGCIIKSNCSTLSEEWTKYWKESGLERQCNHYISFWTAENKVIHVIAENVEIIDS